MDIELRKAIRTLHRAGYEENHLQDLYLEMVLAYLQQYGLEVIFDGISHNMGPQEGRPGRVLSSRSVQFLYRQDLDTQTKEEILRVCCQHASWQDWFHLVTYYKVFHLDQPSAYIWDAVLRNNCNLKATDGTTFFHRMQVVFREYSNFLITCRLRPKYVPETRPLDGLADPWYNWNAELSLVGTKE